MNSDPTPTSEPEQQIIGQAEALSACLRAFFSNDLRVNSGTLCMEAGRCARTEVDTQCRDSDQCLTSTLACANQRICPQYSEKGAATNKAYFAKGHLCMHSPGRESKPAPHRAKLRDDSLYRHNHPNPATSSLRRECRASRPLADARGLTGASKNNHNGKSAFSICLQSIDLLRPSCP